MDEPEIYLIQADGCAAGIEINRNLVEQLVYVPIDSPAGSVGADWPQEPQFTIYPSRTVPVRGLCESTEEYTHLHCTAKKR